MSSIRQPSPKAALGHAHIPAAGALLALLLGFGLAPAASAQTGTRFPLPNANSGPFDIVGGPDGNIWFVETGNIASSIGRLGRITPTGTLTEFPMLASTSKPRGITVGPDGALWFGVVTNGSTHFIGRATTAGVITEFPLPLSVDAPTTITTGPDGNLWFGDAFARLHRMTTAGVVTTFPFPWFGAATQVTTGADGNLWFTDLTSNSIGRMTPAGVPTQFPLPVANSQPDGITAGPDGNVWFTERVNDSIGRITASGVITEFPIPLGATSSRGIAQGPDGNLYFAIRGGAAPPPGMTRLGRVTTSGVVTVLTFPKAGSVGSPNQDGIAQGSDGAMWLTSFNGNFVVRVALGGTPDPGGANFTEHRICTTPNSSPDGIRTGPDGNLWFVEGLGNNVGRITTAGVLTEFPITTPNSQPQGIGAGPDNAMWFAETSANQIGRISMTGVITEFPIPTPASAPIHISQGPDGAMWFTENAGNKIGRITTAGVITEFTIPSPNTGPQEVITGPDGNLWFTEMNGNRIGRLTTGGVFTEFPIPTVSSGPADLTVGSDGALWFTESNQNKIGRITTAGVITEFTVPTPSSGPFGITSGPDGALWFTELNGNKIGRLTTAGGFTEFPIPTPNSTSYGITVGPDGALWFTEYAGNKIGRLSLIGPSTGNRFVSPSFPILADSNGDGRPGAGDIAALFARAGNVFTLLGPWEDCAGSAKNVFTVSDPQPGTGQFRRVTRGTDQMDLGGFNADNRPTMVSFQDLSNPSDTGTVTFTDSNGDGVADGFTATDPGGPINVSMSFVYTDVTADGKADYVSLPWAQTSILGVQPIPGTSSNPQIWIPLADTTGDGVPDSVAFDLDGSGSADPEFFVTPRLRLDRVLSALDFYSLAPCRVLDTRNAPGPLGGPALTTNVLRTFTVAGQCGVPTGAAAISGNITITEPSSPGHMTLFTSGGAEPLVSSINFVGNQTRANNVILVLGSNGEFTVRPALTSGTVHLILDVNGYFANGSGPGSFSGLRHAGALPLSGGSSPRLDWILLAFTAGVCPATWILLKRRRDR